MKKFAVITGICIIVALIIIAVSQFKQAEQQQGPETASKFIPGVYRAEYDKADSKGWKAFLVMEVTTGDEIDKVQFDYVNASGTLKTQDLGYNKQMKSKNGIGPIEYCPRFAKNLMVYQNPDEVDGITGATHSSHDFKTLSQAVYKAAQSGANSTIYIPQSEPADTEAEVKNQ